MGNEGLPTSPAVPFPESAKLALANTQLRRNMGKATQTIRGKRAAVVEEMPDWEALREAGRAIKERTLRHLDKYLIQLEESVTKAGGHVHWARDAEEARGIVREIAQAKGAKEVIKVKSLTTDEIGLNADLEAVGISVAETDLAELIVQLAGDRSSHILVPAIHKNRSEIRELFLRTLGVEGELSDRPADLARAARLYLRKKFLSAPVAVSGANFAVAESGTISVFESEGNGRMCLTLPETLVSVMGIEKVIPTWADMEVYLQLLPRSSTAERMNPYNSFWTGVAPGDGPGEFHLILLDNGRTKVLEDTLGRQALNCIRCSACLNICPVYERTGGHAYNSVYPGPIGAILTPMLVGEGLADSLPYASSLCGACYDVCPVKINIPEVLVHLRGRVVRHKQDEGAFDPEGAVLKLMAWTFAGRRRYELAQRLGRLGQWPMVRDGSIEHLPGPLAAWSAMRDMVPIAKQTFREVVEDPLMTPRDEVLDRIRRALRDVPEAETPESVPVPRDYLHASTESHEHRIEQLIDRLVDYKAAVRRVAPGELPAAIASACRARGVHLLAIPPDLPGDWLPEGLEVRRDHELSHEQLDAAGGVLTGCALAIAQTGTIVLDGGPAQGRRALTLLPDYHLCVVRSDQVVGLVPEAVSRLAPTSTRPMTWISGPSATSDIELNRVEGVHGPRTLEVLIVGA